MILSLNEEEKAALAKGEYKILNKDTTGNAENNTVKGLFDNEIGTISGGGRTYKVMEYGPEFKNAVTTILNSDLIEKYEKISDDTDLKKLVDKTGKVELALNL